MAKIGMKPTRLKKSSADFFGEYDFKQAVLFI